MESDNLTKRESDIEKIVTAVVLEIAKCQNGAEYKADYHNSAAEPKKMPLSKPAGMTHLNGNALVSKTDPIIAFRGAIDTLEAEIILAQHKVSQMGYVLLANDLEEIRCFVHDLIRCEISGEMAKIEKLCGLTDDEIHGHSHHPGKYYGVKHFVPSFNNGELSAYMNKLRVCARETELSACRAFSSAMCQEVLADASCKNADYEIDKIRRQDIIHVLNRLSSLFHVVMVRCICGYYDAIVVEVEASGRHIHLSVEDKEKIFGKDYTLTKVKDLSQPGQYVCKERLTVAGPKGRIDNVVVLGPERRETQIEISATDARTLGVAPVVRQSGDVKDTPGAKIIFNGQELEIKQGVIVAGRHIHVHTSDAKKMKLKDGEFISLKMQGERALTFHNVLVRVSDNFATYAHIDYDEANACGLNKNNLGIIVKEQQR